jgi:hypothetical protein
MNIRYGLPIFLFVFVMLGCVPTINGQASRTWISGVGDDVNPCSRTAPCKTFAGAISKTASGGEIDCLDNGGFGSVTITKSMTLDCTGTQGSILGAGMNGIVVNGGDVVLRIRGLNMNGVSTGLNGIRVVKASSVSVENTVIDGFAAGISVEGAAKVFLSNVSIRNNTSGILTADGTVYLNGTRIFGNKTGLSIKGGSVVSFKNNMIVGNGTDGSPTANANQQ